MYIIHYITVGCIWSMWLEYFTTKNLEGEYGQAWTWVERVFHIALWPVSLLTFIVSMIRNM